MSGWWLVPPTFQSRTIIFLVRTPNYIIGSHTIVLSDSMQGQNLVWNNGELGEGGGRG